VRPAHATLKGEIPVRCRRTQLPGDFRRDELVAKGQGRLPGLRREGDAAGEVLVAAGAGAIARVRGRTEASIGRDARTSSR
jgi:hypothetical protein